MANDPNLGFEIRQRLMDLGIETPITIPSGLRAHANIMDAHTTIMEELGLDLNDDSLRDTPSRVAKMYREELFYGLDYNNFPSATVFENKGRYDEMLATNVTVQSFCEHHFLPFIGTAHIAYIPGDKFLGLSKFNRIVDFFARRPQVQERLTVQIAAAFKFLLKTEDVAVVIKAEHYCVKIRGIKDTCGETVSSSLSGRFRTVPELRAEFLALTRG